MKASAIIRIIAFSLIFLMLLGLLTGGLFIGYFFISSPSGETTTIEREVDSSEFRNLEIDWVAGSVKVMTGISDRIIIRETKDVNNPYTMSTEFDGNTLKISYASKIRFHLGSMSGKDLLIIVPRSWSCQSLEINGAALEINIDNVSIGSIELNGAATEFTFSGELSELDCNGAAAELNVACTNNLSRVNIDGAACSLDLTLPEICGFDVEIDGLAVDFHSDLDYNKDENQYTYGNEHCKIDVSGLGCQITINPS